MTDLKKLQAAIPPFAAFMGLRFVEAGADRVSASLVVGENLCTSGHTAHGGALMASADTTGAAATVLNLPAGAAGTTTLESKTNFVAGAAAGTTLIATATRSTAVAAPRSGKRASRPIKVNSSPW